MNIAFLSRYGTFEIHEIMHHLFELARTLRVDAENGKQKLR